MNLNEKWIKWEPIEGLSRKYYIDSVYDDDKEFKIILSDMNKKNKVICSFKESVDSYTRTNETFRMETIGKIDEIYGTKFYGDWTFFKVENSEYLKWISEESCGISDYRALMHFSFIAADSILDVINGNEPEVILINSDI